MGRRAIWSAIDAGATPVASLLIAAGLVRALGVQDYGLIVIALAVSGLSTSVNPAIAASTTKFVSEASARGAGNTSISKIITGSLITVVAMDALLIGIAVSFGRPLSELIFGPRVASGRLDINLVLLLAIGSICLQQIDGVFAAALKGLEQFGRQAAMEICSRSILAVAVTATAWVSKDVIVTLCAYCCVCAASSIARSLVLMSSMEEGQLFSRPSRADFMRLLSFGGWMWLNAIATMAYGTVDRILVGRVAGMTAAAELSVYIQVAQLVHFVPASLFAFAYPVFSRLGVHKIDNLTAIKELYSKYLRAALCIGLSIALFIGILMHRLLYIVSAGAFQHHHDVAFLLLILNFAILSSVVVPYYAALGLGSPRFVSLVTSLSMLASIILTTFLTPLLGLEGAAVARLAYGLGILTLFFQVRRLLKSE